MGKEITKTLSRASRLISPWHLANTAKKTLELSSFDFFSNTDTIDVRKRGKKDYTKNKVF
jgi:hypothetical protein